MAGDWIKMRVSLAKDTRVIAIANHLRLSSREFDEWFRDAGPLGLSDETVYLPESAVTHIAMSALMHVWGAACEIGKSDGEDAVLPCATLSMIDQISGVPGFGRAMEIVGWAIEESQTDSIRLPRFVRYNVLGHERGATNAERQRRFRAAKKPPPEVGSNGSVTARNGARNARPEKSREEEIRSEKIPDSGSTELKAPVPVTCAPGAPRLSAATSELPTKQVSGRQVTGACASGFQDSGKQGKGVYRGVTVGTLADPVDLMSWYEMATTRDRPVIEACEANLLRVFGAAERAIECGDVPVGLFVSLIQGRQWNRITQAQEDRARRKLKELRE